ncbi:MAG: hypothetical protein WAM92_09320 [Mycobacterium sp.]
MSTAPSASADSLSALIGMLLAGYSRAYVGYQGQAYPASLFEWVRAQQT